MLNVHGRLEAALPEDSGRHLSFFDRGFMYGDSVYEVLRTYAERFGYLREHLERLRRSAQLNYFDLGLTDNEFRTEIIKTVRAFRNQTSAQSKDCYLRVVVSRGRGALSFGQKALKTPPLFVIYAGPLEPFVPSAQTYARGVAVALSPRLRNDARALDPASKTGNYLNNLLAYQEAESRPRPLQDAVLLNAQGHLTEGTSFNVFYIKRGILVTPPLDIGILEGITRRYIIAVARQLGIEVRETRFTPRHLIQADEAFLTGSIKEVLRISHLDEQRIGPPRRSPGPLTTQIHALYREQLQRLDEFDLMQTAS